MTWNMFPDPKEQKALANMDGQALAAALLIGHETADIVVAGVYDVLYALKDRNKAKQILETVMKILPVEHIAKHAGVVVALRINQDGAPPEDQVEYLKLCEEVLKVKVPVPVLSETQALLARFVGMAKDPKNRFP